MTMMEAVRATNPMTSDWQPHPKGFLCRLEKEREREMGDLCVVSLSLTLLAFQPLFSLLILHIVTPLYNVPSHSLLIAIFFHRHKRLIIAWHIDVDILSNVHIKGFPSFPFVSAQNLYIYTCHPVILFEHVNPQPISMIIRPSCLHPYIPVIGIHCCQTKIFSCT